MAQTTQTAGKIVHDVTNSWYFRIYGSLWAICAILVFAALVVLTQRSNRAAQEDDVRFWIQTVNQMNFPRFHFRFDGNETVLQYNCFLESGTPVATSPCQAWHGHVFPANQCFAVNADTITAYNNNSPTDSERIYCNMTTTGNESGNTLIAWEIEGEEIRIGLSAHISTWIAPNNMAWVMLGKSVIATPHGDMEGWSRSLLYHSTVAVPGYYNVATIIGSFQVVHVKANDSYNGWMSIGQIGGFAFFLVILHSIVMIAIGIFMANDSKLLNESAQ